MYISRCYGDNESYSWDDNSIDLWEMYRDYIDGKKEIAECNEAFTAQAEYMTEE